MDWVSIMDGVSLKELPTILINLLFVCFIFVFFVFMSPLYNITNYDWISKRNISN